MKKVYEYTAVLFMLAAIGLAGCSSTGTVAKRDVATVAGGVGGGIVGSSLSHGNTAATIGGALGGAYVGNQLAK